MLTKVLLTDGQVTRDLLWVRHTGSDVYWGDPGQNHKGSYHRSGVLHEKSRSGYLWRSKEKPLQDIEGMWPLTSLLLWGPPSAWPDKYTPEYGGGKADIVMTVDSRSIGPGQTDLDVLLLEPGRWDVLSNRTQPRGSQYEVAQVLVATACSPWIVLLIGQWSSESG